MSKEYEVQQKEKAISKLRQEMQDSKNKLNRYAQAMAPETLRALEKFINQDLEFAEAVNQNSQTFGDCMNEVSKNIKNSISDFDAYGRAAQFYFPGSKIEFCMKIHVNPFEHVESSKEKDVEFKEFSLFDILD